VSSEDRERKRDKARQDIQRNMGLAAQVSQMKQSVMKGKTFKARWGDRAMEPTLLPGDVIEVGGVTTVDLKTGDLVYFQYNEQFLARRIARHSMSGTEMGFLVKAESGEHQDLTIPATQVIGRIVNVERRGQVIQLQRDRGAEMGSQMSGYLGKALDWIQDTIDKINLYFGRRK